GLPVAVEPGRGGAHASHAVSLDQERRHGEPREQVHTELFGSLPQPPHDLAQGRRVEAGVVHGGRRGDAAGAAFGEEIHRLPTHRLAEREPIRRKIGEQLTKRPRVPDCPRYVVLPRAAPLPQPPAGGNGGGWAPPPPRACRALTAGGRTRAPPVL